MLPDTVSVPTVGEAESLVLTAEVLLNTRKYFVIPLGVVLGLGSTKQHRSVTKQHRSVTKQHRSVTKQHRSVTKQHRSVTEQPHPPIRQDVNVICWSLNSVEVESNWHVRYFLLVTWLKLDIWNDKLNKYSSFPKCISYFDPAKPGQFGTVR